MCASVKKQNTVHSTLVLVLGLGAHGDSHGELSGSTLQLCCMGCMSCRPVGANFFWPALNVIELDLLGDSNSQKSFIQTKEPIECECKLEC